MKFVTAEEAARQLEDGGRLGLGGFWFVRTPMALVEAVLDLGVTDLEVVAFGGGLAIERLLAEGRVRRLYFSFHSLDVIGSAPEFRRALESGRVDGVELTTLVMAKALRAAQENLPFLPIRGPEGSEFVNGHFPLAPIRCPTTDEVLRAVPALHLDVAMVHAQRADEHGNVEIVGARGLDLRLLGAAKHRVVSVERVEGDNVGPLGALRTTVPRFLIDAVVESPGGARPSSCLPDYATDLAEIRRRIQRPDEAPVPLERGAAPPENLPTSRGARPESGKPQTAAETLVCALARQLVDGGVYTVGSVTPVSFVAYQLAKRTHAPSLALIPFAGLVDVDVYPATVLNAESAALAAARDHWGMDDLYDLLYSAGRIDAEIFCPAQIDGAGSINNSWVQGPSGRVRLPGQAGIADVATLHRNLYMYVPRHSPRRLVAELDFAGGTRYLVGDEERSAARLEPGEVSVVTNLCVFRQDKASGLLAVESVHAGVTLEQVRQATGFALRGDLGRLPVTPAPDGDLLELLRNEIDPHNVRDIETLPSKQRQGLLSRLLDDETIKRG